MYFRVLIHNTPCATINQVYFVNKLFAIAFVLCYNYIVLFNIIYYIGG